MSAFFYAIYNSIYIKSIRRGLLKVQPIILINCIFIIVLNINNHLFIDIMKTLLGGHWKGIISEVYNSLYMLVKVLIVLAICSELAKIRAYEKQDVKYMGNGISSNMVGFIGVASAFVFSKILTMERAIEGGSSIIIAANWTLLAVVVSIIFSELYIKVYYYILDRRKSLTNSYDKVVRQSVLAIIPSVLTITAVIAVAFVIDAICGDAMGRIGQITIHGANNFLNDMKYIFIKNALWIIGGHGGDLILHDDSFNRLYVDTFTNMGGAGSTLCLIIAILFYSKSKYSKKISIISIIPSTFNINETITYGLPILFNPIYVVPLTVTPLVLYAIAQGAFELGLVEVVNTSMSWTHPVLFNAYKLTGGFSGVILQMINILVGVLMYMPFVKIADTMSKREREGAYQKLKSTIFTTHIEKLQLSTRDDGNGEIGVFLAEELKEILIGSRQNKGELYLEYQPQLNKKGEVMGVEALLRWKYQEFGNIPPNIIVCIAEEFGLVYDLGKWVAKEAIKELSVWEKELDKNITMSINVSTKQLTDDNFAEYIKNMLKCYHINPNNFKVELTESFALGEDEVTKEQLMKLTEYGVKLAIDDFGVGYNPLLYIKKYNIDTIKIDGSLIRDIHKNEESKSIVSSVYRLSESMGMTVINEFVETEEQKAVLDHMGDGFYQGYLFSRPLKANECISYIKNHM